MIYRVRVRERVAVARDILSQQMLSQQMLSQQMHACRTLEAFWTSFDEYRSEYERRIFEAEEAEKDAERRDQEQAEWEERMRQRFPQSTGLISKSESEQPSDQNPPKPATSPPSADKTTSTHTVKLWAYRSKVVSASTGEVMPEDELKLHIKHFVLKDEHALQRITRLISAFEKLDQTASAERERIPEAVRLFVWQRDGGKCVGCGCREKLEFDHIIPVIEGGANTKLNIQLLCESCNRTKGRKISTL